MAAVFEVDREIGYGLAEEIYQQSLGPELSVPKILLLCLTPDVAGEVVDLELPNGR